MANKNKLRHKNSKSVLKTGLILISVIGVITFLIISYLIYSLQCYAYDNNISSDNLNLSVLIKSMPYWTNPTFTAPFDIGAIMQMHGSVWYIYVVALSLLALMLFSKNYDDYKGVEAGSADWATKRDEKDNSDETGIPIGNKFYVTVNNPHGRYYEPHNLNEILIGGPGAGKTFRKIKPDIIQMYGSYVVTDPKGELYRDTAKLLMDNGYKVRVFNLINIKKTNAYNPFVYINDEQDIVVLANTFINASAGDDDKEDFWSGSAKSLLTAIMIYLWKAEGEVKCFGRVVRLLNSITYKNGRIDELCELARCLNKHSIEHPCDAATINWNGIKGTPEETMGGIAKTLSTRLDLWAVEDVNDLTVIDEMDFDNIVTQIQGDQIDLGISGFTYDEDRKVEWSEPYLGSAQVAVVPAGSDITSIDQLAGKSIAAQTGATGEQAAKDAGGEVTGLKNVQDIMNALSANQYDAAVIDSGVAKSYAESGNFTVLDGVLMDEKNYIIAKEGNTDMIDLINKCIEAFIASDDYAKMCEEYGLTAVE